MKCLTLTQPWASLVALGAKRIETRSWRTPYRGTMAIHAAKGFPKRAKETCNEPEFAVELGSGPLPTAAVIATCRLISCLPTRELQQNRVIEVDYLAGCADFLLDDRERAFGDYAPGRWAWLLADVTPITPIPATGALGLWEWQERAA
jgi:activating signal cointegrator 1